MTTQPLDLGGSMPGEASHRPLAADAPHSGPHDVTLGSFMDDMPVGALHRFVVWVVGIGLFFDMYEIFLVSSIGAALQNEYGLDAHSLSFKLLLASAFIGMFFGSLFPAASPTALAGGAPSCSRWSGTARFRCSPPSR